MWMSISELGERSQSKCQKRSRRQRASDLGSCSHLAPNDKLHIVYACNVPLENGMMVHCSNSSTWEDGAGTSLTGGHLELHNKTLFQTLKLYLKMLKSTVFSVFRATTCPVHSLEAG